MCVVRYPPTTLTLQGYGKILGAAGASAQLPYLQLENLEVKEGPDRHGYAALEVITV